MMFVIFATDRWNCRALAISRTLSGAFLPPRIRGAYKSPGLPCSSSITPVLNNYGFPNCSIILKGQFQHVSHLKFAEICGSCLLSVYGHYAFSRNFHCSPWSSDSERGVDGCSFSTAPGWVPPLEAAVDKLLI